MTNQVNTKIKLHRWSLKGCPRCNGDLYREIDINRNLIVRCLQCGYEVESKTTLPYMPDITLQ